MSRSDNISIEQHPDFAISQITTAEQNKTGSWRNIKPVLSQRPAPCRDRCPAGVNVPAVMRHLLGGNETLAVETFREAHPFPAITGRVCPHTCELACNRNHYDSPVSIRDTERYIGELGKTVKPERDKSTGKRVAVVGSGPAGMAACHYLAMSGHSVTLFEKRSIPGGLLSLGIPCYRLPRKVVIEEFETLEELGVELQAKKVLGADFTTEELLSDFDAVIIATGASVERKMNIPGEELVHSGVRFLEALAVGKEKAPPGRVGVVGGGNVAMDVARVLIRRGSEPVLLVRETFEHMPAIPEEIRLAKEDGAQFLNETAVLSYDGKTLTCIKTRLSEEGGKRSHQPVEGSEFQLEVSGLFKAIGETADVSFLPGETITEKGRVSAGPGGATPSAGLFVAGDIVTGPSTVVEAFAAGREAARATGAYLAGQPYSETERPVPVPYDQLNISPYFPKRPREEPPALSISERLKDPKEEEMGALTPQQALSEAGRCFSCGWCNGCSNCWVFCPDVAISWVDETPQFKYDYCKGCGICAHECPGAVLTMVKEREL